MERLRARRKSQLVTLGQSGLALNITPEVGHRFGEAVANLGPICWRQLRSGAPIG
jgi:hypothetical protein